MAVYSVDGNIGSGKSTLIDKLRDKYIIIDEPVSLWKTFKDKNGEDILSKFYKDQDRWSFAFQMMAYISRLSEIKKMIQKYPNKILITERCAYTDYHVFAKMLYSSNKISEIEYKIYCHWFDEFMKDIPIVGYIYLTTPPKTCLERIKQRGRKGEENIPLEYLKMCDHYHKNWLQNERHVLFLKEGNVEKINTFIQKQTNDCISTYIKETGLFIE
tara:strand:- start:22 stop:666 length:645 start_codon:yes stop_codon:yes gene_type:complete